MTSRVSPTRVFHGRTLLLAAIAVAVVGLFLSPGGAITAGGAPSLASLSAHGTTATANVAAPIPIKLAHAATGAVIQSTSGQALPIVGVSSGSYATSQSGAQSGRAEKNAAPTSGAGGTAGFVLPERSAPIPASAAAAPHPTTYLTGWVGENYTDSLCGCYPGDPSIAVGAANVVEATNGQLFFYDKTGTLLSSVSLATFFGLGTDFVYEPRILYDNLSARWFLAVSDFTTYNISIAVSTTSAPVGTWTVYNNIPPAKNQWPEFPSIGVSNSMVGVGVDNFNRTTSYETSELFVFNKAEMVAGVGSSYHFWGVSNGYAFYRDFVATHSLTPSANQYFALQNTFGSYCTWNVTGVPPAASTYVQMCPALLYGYATPVAAAQYGTSTTLLAGSGGIVSSYQQRGLVSSTWSAYIGTTDVVRITQAWPSNGTVRQDEYVYSTVDFLYPSMALDSRGDMTIVTGYSSASYYPSLDEFGQVGSEPYTLSNGGGTVIAGNTYSTVASWGSYAGAALDPTSSEVFAVGEYMSTKSLYWSTFIAGLETEPISVSLAPAATIDLGQPVVLTAAAAGGEGAYHYNWTSLPTGCTNSHMATVSCTPTASGTFSVKVNASDSFPKNASASISFTVNPAPTLAAPTASTPAADIGQTVTFTSATPMGGTPTFTYSWAGLPAGCGSATASSVVCTFTTSGVLSLKVTATDSVTVAAVSPAFSYTVSLALVVGTPTATPASADSGTSFIFGVTASGGSGGNQYAWSGLPTGCTTANSASITCKPTVAGKFNVTVAVTDSNGATVTSAKVLVTVTTPPAAGLFGLSGATGYLLLAVIIAAVAVLLLLLMTRRRKKPTTAPQTWQAGPPAPIGAPPPGATGDVPPGVGGSPPAPPPPP
ncbi:MAG: hypothetical protein L3K15_08780 [Thermoplasmata archaeon]|nr:hypothetical protein [Thermoplasmata archaeon]